MSHLRIVLRFYANRKKIATFGASAFIVGILLGWLLLNFGGTPGLNVPQPPPSPSTLTLSNEYMGRGNFWATLPEITLQVDASEYRLPVNLNEVEGYAELKNSLKITPEQEALLSVDGFVVARVNSSFETLGRFYQYALDNGLPVLITTDAVLHTYHVLFDETLKRIEMNELIDEMNDTISTLLAESRNEAESFAGTVLEHAVKLDFMYLEVAHALIQPSFIPSTTGANAEIQLILNHTKFDYSPIFGYMEDYTQYVPRGHYTENQKLEAYFRTMMWLGRMRFALLDEGGVNTEQTRAAMLFTWMIENTGSAITSWQRVYEVTEFFVGVSDDLTFEDYLAVMNENGITSPKQVQDENTVTAIAQILLQRSKAKILGAYAETYPWLPQEQELQRVLNETSGLRFMGQRFIPDSYMFQQLVFPQVGNLTFPRLFPKGLDVPSVLGSNLAEKILNETEAVYENYIQQTEKLRKEFQQLSVSNWTRNLYWTWLYTANTTLAEISSETKYPSFMTTPEWSYEKLQTFEGTWTELRHDTILYAKQSVTPIYAVLPSFNLTTAYVEPYPETYRRLIGLTTMTINGLKDLQLLQTDVNTTLTKFVDVSELFLNASITELEGKTLDENVQVQIREAARTLTEILQIASDKTQSTTIAVDVHTDLNSERVLEEALGKFNALIVVYAGADGRLYACAGPVYNYFEFTQPMSQRLTDEQWREMLQTNSPNPPEWTNNFGR
jgi:hypothetical protein